MSASSTVNDEQPSTRAPSPSSPRFQVASALTSPYTSSQGESQNGPSASSSSAAGASMTRRSAGAWRASRMQQGRSTTPQLGNSNTTPPSETGKDAAGSLNLSSTSTNAYDSTDMWEPWSVANAALTPPGAVTELPSVASRSPQSDVGADETDTPWITSQTMKKSSIEYDWAGFAHAYSRGKWDPARLPQPPGQSSVFPGTEIRIGARSGEILRPKSPEQPDDMEAVTVRRPSIDYLNPASGSVQRQLSEPDRRANTLEPRPKPPAALLTAESERDHANAPSHASASAAEFRDPFSTRSTNDLLAGSHANSSKLSDESRTGLPKPPPLKTMNSEPSAAGQDIITEESLLTSKREGEELFRRSFHGTLPDMPNLLARIGQSTSSPNFSSYIGVGRRIETFYKDYGYLPAMMPPDETERRQALRRYGPPRLRGDSNFERIAQLVKLVFNTKLVLISLVGEKTQFFQTEVGAKSFGFNSDWLKEIASARDCSMCGHAILQPNDEPLVVLDTQKDWRFAGNPLVVGEPHIRFYAGGPLRTSDGFNLGSLCIIDDKPWDEFSPRQRHTLREFSRVAMREMELIRDTIHLQTQDRMQHSIELFTRKCIEMESTESDDDKEHSQGLQQVYALATKSMVDALQATGAVIFDLSHFELVSSPGYMIDEASEQSTSKNLPAYQYPESISFAPQANDTDASPDVNLGSNSDERLVPPMAVLGACETLPTPTTRGENVPGSHYARIAEFLRRHRTGSFFPFTPLPLRHLLPTGVSNVLLVPIFGLNRQPFALLCAYSRHTEDGPTLEDVKESGLQYLRAKGTIILSAILKKDIMLADKAKSHFISNISHELRTPLHGILAAAELLAETKLNAMQGSYLETVEACGKSLLELVNHVLDFTKLSGNIHAKQLAMKPFQKCDLVKLVQEVCESSWIGQMAKNLESQQHAGIGSAYAKGSESSSVRSSDERDRIESSGMAGLQNSVETVIDISCRPRGWLVNCDAGGIRRVLMNLIGNSLKFTSKGFVHISLREVQSTETHVLVELGVTDTGKGISRSFLEEQLFHPFTQENHLGPGTGLGLSIVNSIVQSPAINGKIDVWSTVGQGTEIRVTCELEVCDPDEAEGPIYQPVLNVKRQRSISYLGFDESLRGQSDLKDVLRSYCEDWWQFKYEDNFEESDLVLINDDFTLIRQVGSARSDPLPPIILLAGARGSAKVTRVCEDYQSKGGVVRTLFKPAGPAKLEAVIDFCLQCVERSRSGLPMLDASSAHSTPLPSPAAEASEGMRKDYFDHTSSQTLDDDAVTPRGPPPTQQAALRRPKLSSDLRQNSHHISPGPPSSSDTVLLRRHSSEGRSVKRRPNVISEEQEGEEEARGEAEQTTDGKGAEHHASSLSSSSRPTSSSKSAQGEKTSRPLLPTRSITYHEPRLGRHVLMSPLRSPHFRRGDQSGAGEPLDYFGPAAASTFAGGPAAPPPPPSSFSSSLDVSGPSSPGSVISLDGGEGAVLRSAIHNAGLIRHTGGLQSHYKKRLQVLSVEDNSINRRVLAAFFAKMDVDLVEATNGEEGVKAFEAHPPFHFDVIFMDLSMPVLDGIGATMQIRKIEADRFRTEQSNTFAWIKSTSRSAVGGQGGSTSSAALATTNNDGQRHATTSPSSSTALLGTPGNSRPSAQARAKIFALTGRSSDEDKRRAFATGADGFIVKPLSYKVLSSLIATISAYK